VKENVPTVLGNPLNVTDGPLPGTPLTLGGNAPDASVHA